MKSKALLVVFALSQLTCHQAPFTAGPGTSMQCFANPPNIPSTRGVSVISCLLQEDEIGTLVPDGTVVQFFTDLGRIPEQGKTNDGVVRVNFESTGLSGEAHIAAFSGGGSAPGGGGGGSTSTIPTSTSINVERTFSASGNQVSAGLSGISASDQVTVTVGNASRVFLAADPTRITETRPAALTANVTDGGGNPAAGVPVFFSVTTRGVVVGTATPGPGGAAPTESLDSQGQPVFTDTNGQARDTLRTRWPRDGAPRSVDVSAQTASGTPSNTVTIAIN